jgi:hypothetical protein
MLRRLAKDAGSPIDNCPAVYVEDEDVALMVGQGKRLDERKMAELEDLAADETAVLIPTETVLRAAARLLAEHGRPRAAEDVEGFLAELEKQ